MATITPVAGSSNTVLTPQAATSSDTLAMGTNQRCILQIINGSGGSINVTLAGTNTCNFGSTHNLVVACAVGTTPIEISGTLLQQVVSATGNVTVTYSATTSITVAAVTT